MPHTSDLIYSCTTSGVGTLSLRGTIGISFDRAHPFSISTRVQEPPNVPLKFKDDIPILAAKSMFITTRHGETEREADRFRIWCWSSVYFIWFLKIASAKQNDKMNTLSSFGGECKKSDRFPRIIE